MSAGNIMLYEDMLPRFHHPRDDYVHIPSKFYPYWQEMGTQDKNKPGAAAYLELECLVVKYFEFSASETVSTGRLYTRSCKIPVAAWNACLQRGVPCRSDEDPQRTGRSLRYDDLLPNFRIVDGYVEIPAVYGLLPWDLRVADDPAARLPSTKAHHSLKHLIDTYRVGHANEVRVESDDEPPFMGIGAKIPVDVWVTNLEVGAQGWVWTESRLFSFDGDRFVPSR